MCSNKNINSPVPEWPYKQAVSVTDKSGGWKFPSPSLSVTRSCSRLSQVFTTLLLFDHHAKVIALIFALTPDYDIIYRKKENQTFYCRSRVLSISCGLYRQHLRINFKSHSIFKDFKEPMKYCNPNHKSALLTIYCL